MQLSDFRQIQNWNNLETFKATIMKTWKHILKKQRSHGSKIRHVFFHTKTMGNKSNCGPQTSLLMQLLFQVLYLPSIWNNPWRREGFSQPKWSKMGGLSNQECPLVLVKSQVRIPTIISLNVRCLCGRNPHISTRNWRSVYIILYPHTNWYLHG